MSHYYRLSGMAYATRVRGVNPFIRSTILFVYPWTLNKTKVLNVVFCEQWRSEKILQGGGELSSGEGLKSPSGVQGKSPGGVW